MNLLIPSMPEYGYHRTINRKTLQREKLLEQFRKKDTHLIPPSVWIAVALPVFMSVYA